MAIYSPISPGTEIPSGKTIGRQGILRVHRGGGDASSVGESLYLDDGGGAGGILRAFLMEQPDFLPPLCSRFSLFRHGGGAGKRQEQKGKKRDWGPENENEAPEERMCCVLDTVYLSNTVCGILNSE